jgi:hypothetical protein
LPGLSVAFHSTPATLLMSSIWHTIVFGKWRKTLRAQIFRWAWHLNKTKSSACSCVMDVTREIM